MPILMVVETLEYAGRDLSVERDILGSDVTVKRFTYTGNEDELINACQGADCILTDYTPFSARVIQQLDICKLISVDATGFGLIDVAAAAEANISVCAIDEYCTEEVADHTLLLILTLARKLRAYDQQVQIDRVWQYDTFDGLVRLKSKTLGLIGFGRIGQAVARRAIAFGLNVIACDPHANRSVAQRLDVQLCDLDAIFARSDILSLHCAETPDNQQFINQRAFDAMDKAPMLINVARGALIDESALCNALDSGQISAAGLDVLASESPMLDACDLLGRDNVVLTPHIAFYSDAAILESRTISAGNVRHFLLGEHNEVRQYVHHAK